MTALVSVLLESSIRAAVLAAMVACLLPLARVRSSAVRHGVWTAVLCAMLLMPVLPYCLPSLPLPVSAGPPAPAASFAPAAPRAPVLPRSPAKAAVAAPLSTAAPEPARPVPQASASTSPVWPLMALGVYAAGVAWFLARFLIGWWSAGKVARSGAAVTELNAAAPVCESARVASPLIAGLLAPRIILPLTWKDWTPEKVRGVLAHESAHIRRRDPLIALLANLNRCVFWFHPLAWWLGRQVAIAAEHACDEAGARAMGEGRRYAEVLLEMAEAVRARGGRLVWQGVGMEGAGPLENRINRLLRGDAFQRVSRLRKSIAGLCCAAAIFVAAACRTQPGALVDDPQIKASLANSAEEMFPSIRGLTAGDIAQLEEALRKNPDDLRTRGRLLLFYATRGEQVFGREKTIEARRPHVLWLIEHHPEDSMHGYARLFNEADRLPDPVGYAEARPLWLAQAGRSDASAAALNNAARFFEAAEPKLSEEFLIRARADDPNGRGATNLGWFYARVLSGTILGFLNPTEVDTPFAREIRAKLALSSDAELLLATGQALGYSSRQQAALTDLGKSYVERALHLDAHSLPARRVLVGRRHEEHRLKMWQVCPKLATDLACPAVYSLPESEQLVVLPLLAEVAFDRGDMDRKVAERRSRAAADWDHARKYAEAARQVAERFRGDPDCGTTLYTADLALGLVALQNGDPKTAQKMLLEASEAPPSEELSYYYNSLDYRLPARLLRTGDERGVVPYLERFIGMKPDNQELVQTVATYLDRMAEVRVDNANLIESAALIRAGHRPVWYFKY